MHIGQLFQDAARRDGQENPAQAHYLESLARNITRFGDSHGPDAYAVSLFSSIEWVFGPSISTTFRDNRYVLRESADGLKILPEDMAIDGDYPGTAASWRALVEEFSINEGIHATISGWHSSEDYEGIAFPLVTVIGPLASIATAFDFFLNEGPSYDLLSAFFENEEREYNEMLGIA